MTAQTDPASTGASLEQELQKLRSGFSLRQHFPPVLERQFGRWLHDKAMHFLRQYLGVLIGLYALIVLVTAGQFYLFADAGTHQHDTAVYWCLVISIGLITGAFALFARNPRLDRWFWLYSGIANTLMLTAMTVGITAFEQARLGQINICVLFIGFAVVFGTGLQPVLACAIIGSSAGALSLLLRAALGLPLDLAGFVFYYAVIAFGMLFSCHFMARTHRQVFLQERLLLDDKQALLALSEELAALSQQDPLTQVANRRCFDDALSREWDRALRNDTTLALLFVDVDHFKRYNDRYGHQAGDDCLRIVARTLGEQARRPGDLTARYGGEEFVLLLPETDVRGALEIGQRVRDAVAALNISHEESGHLRVTVSVGAAALAARQAGASPEQLLATADKAVYAAKLGGRHRVEAAA